MKKFFLFITCALLLLGGCKTANTTSAPDTSETVSNAKSESKEEHLKELIADYPVDIQGIQWIFSNGEPANPNNFSMYMVTPEIIEYAKNTVTASGILSNQWHATEEAITVQYSLQDDLVLSASPSEEGAFWLTPAISFPSEEAQKNIRYRTEVGTPSYQYFTYEDYPLIEIGEGIWHDNYSYEGTLIVTDKDGKKYMISHMFLSYSDYYGDDDWRWQFNIADHLEAIE